MNSKLKTVLLIILLFIPTYLAVAEYVKLQSPSVEDSRIVEKMKIEDPDGGLYTFSADKGDDSDDMREIEFLTAVNKSGREQPALPDAMNDVKVFKVTYESFNKTSVYEYYFSDDPDSAFYKDPEGKIFKISQENAASFLCKDYAACLYGGSEYPVLTVCGETVLPQSMTWRYQLFNGTYQPMETPTTDGTRTYRMNARLGLSFNLEPDVIAIQVYDGDDLLYEGNYSGLSGLTMKETKLLHFHIEATWYEIEGKEGQGESVYDFMGRVNAPASFYLNVNTLDRGEFCVVTVKDKPEDAEIRFVSEPDIGYDPVFIEDGDYYRALVPMKPDLAGGEYTFTVSCDGVTQELLLNLTEKQWQGVGYTISKTTLNATRTEATLASFDETMTPVAKSLRIAADHLFDGLFIEGVPEGSQLFTGYGRLRKINDVESSRYQHLGVDYLVAEDSDIRAVNDGVVIYVGSTDLSGNIIVIEHGLGLKSWYCHLNEAKVSVGDTVKKGDVIAASGATGFCEGGTAHIGLSVFDVAVCPYDLWEEPIKLDNP